MPNICFLKHYSYFLIIEYLIGDISIEVGKSKDFGGKSLILEKNDLATI